MIRSLVARTLVATAAATAGLVAVPATSQATADSARADTTTAATPAMDTEEYEERVRTWINTMRAKRDLKQLRFESCTDQAAERWGSYLARNGRFYHQPLENLMEGCDARYAGETLAMGVASPRQMVRLWMRSPGHRRILLSKSPRRIGISAYPSNGQWVVTADFTRF